MAEGRQLNSHRPFHIYYGHTYFVSGRILDGLHIMCGIEKKIIFRTKLGEISKEMDIGIIAWVVLNNHYHILFRLKNEQGGLTKQDGLTNASLSSDRVVNASSPIDKLAFVNPHLAFVNPHQENPHQEKLVRFIKRLHSITAKEFNKLDHTPSRRVWYQYWDYCIRNIPDFWMHFNYIIQNPLKHGLVKNLYSAYYYEFSSNPVWLKRFAADGLWESFVKYPVKDWTPSDCE